MERRLFFTSPVDHPSLGSWPSLAEQLKKAVEASCDKPTVTIGSEPVFGYGTDVDETFAALGEQRVDGREVRIDLWCSIRLYAAVCLTLGPAIRRNERRALVRRLKSKELASGVFLREHEGPYDLDSGRVYGYSLSPADDKDKSTIEMLLFPFDEPIYLGEHWLLQGEDESVDDDAFELITRVGPNLALFFAHHQEAAERIWEASVMGEGLVVLYADDPAEALITRRFTAREDLAIFVAEEPGEGMRVTLGRGHPEDSLVVVYDPPYAPEIDEDVLFVI